MWLIFCKKHNIHTFVTPRLTVNLQIGSSKWYQQSMMNSSNSPFRPKILRDCLLFNGSLGIFNFPSFSWYSYVKWCWNEFKSGFSSQQHNLWVSLVWDDNADDLFMSHLSIESSSWHYFAFYNRVKYGHQSVQLKLLRSQYLTACL